MQVKQLLRMLSYQRADDVESAENAAQQTVRENLLKLLSSVNGNPSSESLSEGEPSRDRFKYAEIPSYKHTITVPGTKVKHSRIY